MILVVKLLTSCCVGCLLLLTEKTSSKSGLRSCGRSKASERGFILVLICPKGRVAKGILAKHFLTINFTTLRVLLL